MNRRKLTDVIAKDTGFSKRDSSRALNAFLNAVSKSLARKERVTLMDFGTFYTTTRRARKARNPRTGERIELPKRTVARWRASPEIQSKVN